MFKNIKMKIVTEGGEYKFSIPVDLVDISEIQDFIDIIRFKSLTSKSNATDADVEELSEDINESWWLKTKGSFDK